MGWLEWLNCLSFGLRMREVVSVSYVLVLWIIVELVKLINFLFVRNVVLVGLSVLF